MTKGKPRNMRRSTAKINPMEKAKTEKQKKRDRLRCAGFGLGTIVSIVIIIFLIGLMPPATPQRVAVKLTLRVNASGFEYNLDHFKPSATWPSFNENITLPGYAWLGYFKRSSDGYYFNFEDQLWQESTYRLEKSVGSSTEEIVWQATVEVNLELDIYLVLATVTNHIKQDVAIVGVAHV